MCLKTGIIPGHILKHLVYGRRFIETIRRHINLLRKEEYFVDIWGDYHHSLVSISTSFTFQMLHNHHDLFIYSTR